MTMQELNTRVYMIQNGLDDCGLKKEKIDELYGAFGYISVKLRSDWTHFNAYGYYSKGVGIYKKGVELGYWEQFVQFFIKEIYNE